MTTARFAKLCNNNRNTEELKPINAQSYQGIWTGRASSLRNTAAEVAVDFPFILAPLGFFLARALGFLKVTSSGLIYFDVVKIHYGHLAVVFPAVLVVYYLVWKYLVGFFNRVAGITEK
jgi:hypothetical protein